MTMYAAIRKDASTGKEWIDTGSLSALPDEARTASNRLDNQLPSWAQVNPIMRIGTIRIEEAR